MQNYIIKNIQVVNEKEINAADVFIKNGRIEKIGKQVTPSVPSKEINGEGKYLFPGVIDDQVHFREPGLTHKANIYSESKAAVAGGVTSFMEMPNTRPPAFSQELLEEKYAVAAKTSLANYSFYMGTSNGNAEDALKANSRKKEICGIKIFMGSSTGNLLVDNPLTLDKLFSESELLIATHCEDERVVRSNYERLKKEKGNKLSAADHPLIRNEEGCYESSLYAIQLAKKYDARLHILHISTEKELGLFSNMAPLNQKRITAEVCVHHLHFTSDDYTELGYLIKCNPAIKSPHNKAALWKALLDNRLDVIATDHAPHTLGEKGFMRNKDGILCPARGEVPYENAPAGLPLVQHPLLMMLYYYKKGMISLEKIAEKMCHAVADCFRMQERGYIREGYFADLVIVDLNDSTTVTKENILYKCQWSPLEGGIAGTSAFTSPASITHTFVNGNLVYVRAGNTGEADHWDESQKGQRILFDR